MPLWTSKCDSPRCKRHHSEGVSSQTFSLCPDADCHQETPRAIADFSRKVSLEPGEKTLYKFDVELHGRARTYSITILRLTGKETDLRHLVVQGG